MTETEHGNYLQQAVDRAAREYGEGTTVRVRFTGGQHGCTGYQLLGKAENADETEVKA